MSTKKLLALLLVLVMCVSLVAGCNNNGTADSSDPGTTTSQGGNNPTNTPDDPGTSVDPDGTLVVSVEQGLEGKFSPFFYLSANDATVVESFTLYTLMTDRVGGPINNGIAGETRSYNGVDYTYTGPADVHVTENADGTVTYTLKIRDDIKFTDGKPATIDDVIFGIYVYLDPTYDGNATMYSVPIVGLADYRDAFFDMLAKAGRDNDDFSKWTEEEQVAFWAELDEAGVAFTQEIIDYCIAAGYNTADDDMSVIASTWGFSVAEGGTVEDYWAAIDAAYGGDYKDLSDTESAGSSLFELMPNYADVYSQQPEGAADYISGIERVDDYTLTLTTEYLDATAIYQMSLPIAPLHWYGDESQYDYTAHKFGFPKGDLSIVKAKTTTPLGCGPYIFNDYSNGVVYMDANPDYYKGQPQVAHLNYLESSEDSKITGIVAGTLDVADPSYSTDTAKQIAKENGFSEDDFNNFDGPVITTILIDYRG